MTARATAPMLAAVPVAVRSETTLGRGLGAARVRRAGEAMLRVLRRDRAELSILLCDDRAMRRLNRRHRGKDRPTDVLAFALQEGPALATQDPQLLGDVVISVQTAVRQARARAASPADEVLLLLAHGLLHLLGDDHRTAGETRRMSARTDLLVAAARKAWLGSTRRS